MFRVIGAAVVFGFALYGLGIYLKRPDVMGGSSAW
jgi:hypothetical protein